MKPRAGGPGSAGCLGSSRGVIESRWVSTPLAFAGQLQPRRLNSEPFQLQRPRLNHGESARRCMEACQSEVMVDSVIHCHTYTFIHPSIHTYIHVQVIPAFVQASI
eukprot:COSAG01_NODE_1134_length_11558_cov_8.381360_4_plen_106_part_00